MTTNPAPGLASPSAAAFADEAPAPSPAGRTIPLCAAACALLLYLCYFPVAWGTVLGWVALVPLLMLVRSRARPRVLYPSAFLAGVLFYIPVLQWMRVADPRMYFTWIGLSLCCAAFFPPAILLVRWIGRRTALPLLVTFPTVWVALEFLRAHIGGGFPWYLLAYSQQSFLPLIQIADVTGPYGLSLLLAAVNVVVFGWLFRLAWVRQLAVASDEVPSTRPVLVAQSALVLVAFTGFFAYGSWRLSQDDFTPGPRVALVQTNLPQQIRNDRNTPDDDDRGKAVQTMGDHVRDLGDLAALQSPRPDMIAWPETSWPNDWIERTDGKQTKGAQAFSVYAADRWKTNVLMGLNAQMWEPGGERPLRRYNSAVLVGSDSKFLGRYDKIHRVPFGEYVPFKDVIPLMNEFSPYDFDYSVAAGEEQKRLPLGTHRFGVVICYEDTDPQLAREYVNPAGGPPADFVLNISNDGWFDGTSEHEEHLAICRFRAIECRRATLRAVNMGITAVIDGNGRVLAPQKQQKVGDDWVWQVDPALGPTADLPESRWRDFKQVTGVMVAVVPLDGRDSLYARLGDWVPWSCWAALGGFVLLGFVRPRKS